MRKPAATSCLMVKATSLRFGGVAARLDSDVTPIADYFVSFPEWRSFFEASLQIFSASPAKVGTRVVRPDHPGNGASRGGIAGVGRLRPCQHGSDRRHLVQVAEDRLSFFKRFKNGSARFAGTRERRTRLHSAASSAPSTLNWVATPLGASNLQRCVAGFMAFARGGPYHRHPPSTH